MCLPPSIDEYPVGQWLLAGHERYTAKPDGMATVYPRYSKLIARRRARDVKYSP